MQRKTFDKVVSFTGLTLAALLVVAGSLLAWGHNFINDEVHTQLAAQKIYFPPANSAAVKAPEFAPMRQYGGELLASGQQAEVYADYFIANHLKEIGGGKTYSQLSAESLAHPNDAQLAGTVQTMFRGETLRGLLLNAYAFGTMGSLAGIAAIVSFVAGGLLLLLSGLGLAHSYRVPATQKVFDKLGATKAAQPTA